MAPSQVESFDPALKKRIASGLVLAVVTIIDVVLGGWFLAAMALILGAIMGFEWAGLTCVEASGHRIKRLVAILVGAGAALAILAAMLSPVDKALALLALAAVLAAGIAAIATGAPVGRTAFGVTYIGLPLACLIWLRNSPEDGLASVIWLLVVVWSVDTFAYFAGRGIGGPKLLPSISPKKTWAGLIGGMVGAGIVGMLLARTIELGWWQALLIALLLAFVAQAGDFFESWLKRRAGVKDSGNLIPGHGGLLDRLDGLLFATPVFTLLFFW